nr:tetratricopeptide repeat protein [uncultured Roseibium sp.]
MKRIFLYWIPSALITALVVLFVVTDPRVLEISANAGSATAARWLGEHYNGREKKARYDPEKALHWFERAAELGSVDALYEIGDLHLYASIEGHTYKTAHDFYRRAAEGGHIGAMHQLAVLLEFGLGTDKDLAASERWFRKVIELSDEATGLNLTLLYFAHPEDFSAEKVSGSIEDIKRLAGEGDLYAMYALASAHLAGEPVPKDVDKGLSIYFELAEKEPYFAHEILGEIYLSGESVEPDYEKALDHFRKAIKAGNTSAHYHLAEMREYGLGVEQDYSKAAYQYSKSIDAKHFGGLTNLGILHRDGAGVEQDHEEAIRLFRRAEELEIRGGAANIGWMQLHGLGLPKDASEGLALIEAAADEEDAYGAYYLAKLLEEGDIVAQDRGRALELYGIAAERRFFPARVAVKRLEAAPKDCSVPQEEKAGRRCPAFPYR